MRVFLVFAFLGFVGCGSLTPDEKDALNNLINVFGTPQHGVLPPDQSLPIEAGEE